MKIANKKSLTLVLATVILSTVGCASIKSTLVTRNESNQGWEKQRHLKGVPITLKVPTHLKVYVFDKHYVEIVTIGGKEIIQPSEIDVPIRDFGTELIKTDKIFTVDFKRPGAGPYGLKLDLDEKQYIAKIQHDVTDNTLQKVSQLVDTVTNQKGILPTPKIASGFAMEVKTTGGDIKLKEIQSIAAVGVFEIDAPDFEQQVANFLNCHLNKSHDAFVTPPGSGDTINRVGITGNLKAQVPLCAPNCSCNECPGN